MLSYASRLAEKNENMTNASMHVGKVNYLFTDVRSAEITEISVDITQKSKIKSTVKSCYNSISYIHERKSIFYTTDIFSSINTDFLLTLERNENNLYVHQLINGQ